MAWSASSAVVVAVLSATTLWSIPADPPAPNPTRYGVTAEDLGRLVACGHFELDRDGGLRSVEPLATPGGTTPTTRAPDDVFALHSRPGSAHTIYLGFDGHTAENTEWRGGIRLEAPPYDADGSPTTFSRPERDTVYEVFL